MAGVCLKRRLPSSSMQAFLNPAFSCRCIIVARGVCTGPTSRRVVLRTRGRSSWLMCAASEKENSAPAPTPQKKIRPFGVLRQFLARRGALKAEALRNYGLAAIIAYGMFDALTYSFSFLLSLRAYLAAGKELTWKTLPQVLALMWGINNLSRPFRIAGALALAPIVDRRLVKPLRAFISRLRAGNGTS